MSKTIDERVVSMEFNNSNFEKNATATMSTLDKLKQSLNLGGASKSLEEVGNASDTVKVKFSALNVVGMTMIQNLTNSVLGFANKLKKDILVDPIKEGFNEYEEKLKSAKVMMNSTGESLDVVNAELQKLADYSNVTIYSFKDMTDSVSKFTNAGLGLKESRVAIEGICNVAALAGATTNDASRAMYNFAQAMGTGYVQLIDWKSIENANMATKDFKNTLVDTAIEMGTLTKTAEHAGTTAKGNAVDFKTFNNTLSDQWLTSEVLTAALSKYADETTELGQRAMNAAKQVYSFSSLMNVLKMTFQNGWDQTWEIIFGDLDQATEMWTEINDVVGGALNDITKARNALVEQLFTSNWYRLSKQISGTGVDLEVYKQKLIEAGIAAGTLTQEEADGIKTNKDFEKSLEKGWASTDLIKQTLNSLADGTTAVSQSTEEAQAKFAEFQKLVDDTVMGKYGNGADRVKAFADAGIDYAKVQGLVNKQIYEGSICIDDLNEEQLEMLGITKEQAEQLKDISTQIEGDFSKMSGRQLILETIGNTISGIKTVIDAIKTAFVEVFDYRDSVSVIYNFLDGLHSISKNFVISEEGAGTLTNAFKALFSVIKPISDFIGTVFNFAIKTFFTILGDGVGILVKVASWAYETSVKFKDWAASSELVQDALTKVSSKVNTAKSKVRGWIESFESLPIVNDAILKFKLLMIDLKYDGVKYFEKAAVKVSEWIDSFKQLPIVVKAMDYFNTKSAEMSTALHEWLDKVKQLNGFSFENAKSAIVGFVTTIYSHMPTLQDIGKMVSNVIGAIGDTFIWLKNKIFPPVNDAVDTVTDKTQFLAVAFSGIGQPGPKGIASNLGIVGDAVSKFGGILTGFGATLSKYYDIVKDKISKINIGQILAVAMGYQGFQILKSFAKLSSALADFVSGISKIEESLAGLIDGVTSSLTTLAKAKAKAMKIDAISGAIKAIGKAIVEIGIVIAILSQLPVPEAWSAVGMLAALLAVLYVFIRCVSKFNVTEAAKASLIITALGVAVRKMANALLIISLINSEKLVGSVVALIFMIAALSAACIAIAKWAPAAQIGEKIFKQLAKSLVIMSVALGIISLIDAEKLEGSVNALIFMIAALSVAIILIAALAPAMQVGEKVFKQLAKSLLIMSIALGIISLINAEKLEGSVKTLAAMMVGICVILEIMAAAGPNIDKGGIAIKKVAVALLLLVVVIKLVSHFTMDDIIASIAVFGSIIVLFVIISKVMKYVGDSGANVDKAGIALVGMAAAMILIAMVIKLMIGIDLGTVIVAGVTIALFTALMLVFVKSMEGVNASNIGHAAAVILAFGVCMLVLSVAMFILSSLDPGGLVLAALCVAGIGYVLSLIVKSFAGNDAKALKQATKAILQLTICVGVIAVALAIMTLLDPVKTAVAAACIAGILFVISLIMKATKDVKPCTGTLIGIAAILVAVGAVLVILSQLPWQSSLIAAGALAIVLVALGLTMLLISKIQVDKNTVVTIALMVAILVVIGVIVNILGNLPMENALVSAIATGMLILALAAAMWILSNCDISVKQMVALGIMLACLIVIAVILQKLNDMAIQDGFLDKAITLGIVIGALMVALLLVGKAGWMADVLKNAALMALALALIGGAITLLAYALNAVSDVEGLPLLLLGIAAGLAAVVVAGYAANFAAPGLIALGAACLLLGAGLFLVAEAIRVFREALGLMDEKTTETANNVAANCESVNNSVTETQETVQQSMDETTQSMSDGGTNMSTGFMDNATNGLSGFKDMISGVMGGGNSAITDSLPDFLNNGKDLGLNITDGADSGLGDFEGMIKDYMGGGASAVDASQMQYNLSGMDLGSMITGGADNGMSGLSDMIGGNLQDTLGSMNSFQPSFSSIGGFLMSGLKNGITNKFSEIKNAAVGVVSGVKDSICNFLGIHSPSRVFMQIGDYMDQGLIIGIESLSDKVSDSATGVGESAVDGMSEAIGQMANMVDGDLDVQPTIRPVLDMSDVESGISGIDTMFGRNRALAASASITATQSSLQNGRLNSSESNLASAVNKLIGLTEKTNDLLSNQGVYLDGDTLVGKIAPSMNKELGALRKWNNG